MNRNLLLAALAGGVTLLFLAGLFYGVLEDLFANEVMRAAPIWWALLLSQFLQAAVLAVVLSWKGVADAREGLQAGAVFGGLLGLAMALMGYAAMEDVQTIATVFGHTLIGAVTNGGAGAVIGMVLRRGGGPA